MKRFYSRLAAVEEKKSIRRAITFTILTVLFLILFILFGLPLFAKLTGLFLDLKKSNLPVTIADTTPPGPPSLDPPPKATNKSDLSVSGRAESGSVVTLMVENQKQEVLATADGSFSFRVKLVFGQNNIYASARDKAGNESTKSEIYLVTFTNKSPKLDISSPLDGASFFGDSQITQTIKGITDPTVLVTLNDRVVRVADDRSFSYNFQLNPGDNILTIKAVDEAGNTTEKLLTLRFNQ